MCSQTAQANRVQEGRRESQVKARNPESKQRASAMAVAEEGGWWRNRPSVHILQRDQGQDSLGPRHQHTGETEPDAQTADTATSRRSSSQSSPLALLFPRRVWPKAPQVKDMESSCRASRLGSGEQTLFSGRGGPLTGGGRKACSQSHQAGWRKRR